ncbi:conserved Plasmodium protein, unknown function [Plasmodium gaboni]|uniref:Tubby C-terminal domain-containing protein n=1 Tax=Plasmodium gaboni TaxID=647221 RepID=A0ABY1UT34_9APIC|nr:conserved Plasmodium protein, unknown function [Plasmodium gaboni]
MIYNDKNEDWKDRENRLVDIIKKEYYYNKNEEYDEYNIRGGIIGKHKYGYSDCYKGDNIILIITEYIKKDCILDNYILEYKKLYENLDYYIEYIEKKSDIDYLIDNYFIKRKTDTPSVISDIEKYKKINGDMNDIEMTTYTISVILKLNKHILSAFPMLKNVIESLKHDDNNENFYYLNNRIGIIEKWKSKIFNMSCKKKTYKSIAHSFLQTNDEIIYKEENNENFDKCDIYMDPCYVNKTYKNEHNNYYEYNYVHNKNVNDTYIVDNNYNMNNYYDDNMYNNQLYNNDTIYNNNNMYEYNHMYQGNYPDDTINVIHSSNKNKNSKKFIQTINALDENNIVNYKKKTSTFFYEINITTNKNLIRLKSVLLLIEIVMSFYSFFIRWEKQRNKEKKKDINDEREERDINYINYINYIKDKMNVTCDDNIYHINDIDNINKINDLCTHNDNINKYIKDTEYQHVEKQTNNSTYDEINYQLFYDLISGKLKRKKNIKDEKYGEKKKKKKRDIQKVKSMKYKEKKKKMNNSNYKPDKFFPYIKYEGYESENTASSNNYENIRDSNKRSSSDHNSISSNSNINSRSSNSDTNNKSSNSDTNNKSSNSYTNNKSSNSDTSNISSNSDTNNISSNSDTNNISSNSDTNNISSNSDTNNISSNNEKKIKWSHKDMYNCHNNYLYSSSYNDNSFIESDINIYNDKEENVNPLHHNDFIDSPKKLMNGNVCYGQDNKNYYYISKENNIYIDKEKKNKIDNNNTIYDKDFKKMMSYIKNILIYVIDECDTYFNIEFLYTLHTFELYYLFNIFKKLLLKKKDIEDDLIIMLTYCAYKIENKEIIEYCFWRLVSIFESECIPNCWILLDDKTNNQLKKRFDELKFNFKDMKKKNKKIKKKGRIKNYTDYCIDIFYETFNIFETDEIGDVTSEININEGNLYFKNNIIDKNIFINFINKTKREFSYYNDIPKGYKINELQRIRKFNEFYSCCYILKNDKKEKILMGFKKRGQNKVYIYKYDKNIQKKFKNIKTSFNVSGFLGVLVCNFTGMKIKIYDNGISEKYANFFPNFERNNVISIRFESNIISELPRHFICNIYKENKNIKLIYENKCPIWNEEKEIYELPFYGRVKMASAKNLQLILKKCIFNESKKNDFMNKNINDIIEYVSARQNEDKQNIKDKDKDEDKNEDKNDNIYNDIYKDNNKNNNHNDHDNMSIKQNNNGYNNTKSETKNSDSGNKKIKKHNDEYINSFIKKKFSFDLIKNNLKKKKEEIKYEIINNDEEEIFLIFGKNSKDYFTLDFRHPLSTFEAFSVAISSLLKKKAVS